MSWDALLTDTNFNETFKIHTDASVFQLGSVIIQKGKPIDFYSRKRTYAQKWYIVMINRQGVTNAKSFMFIP